jgi:hypothetical protein
MPGVGRFEVKKGRPQHLPGIPTFLEELGSLFMNPFPETLYL